MTRLVSWFSCGAASAAATKLALLAGPEFFGVDEIKVVYCDTSKREHPDNARFMRDCEEWFGQPILIAGNDEYDRDPDKVFRKTRYLVGPKGARCTAELKKSVRWEYSHPTDVVLLGFTRDEYKRRFEPLQKSEPMTRFHPLLSVLGFSKGDCFRMVEAAGIELPIMYRLGYRNNNCIGCVKGGAGYWNKIRQDFPERFQEMAAIERELGRTICKRGDGKRERIYLDQLPVGYGNYKSEPDISCGIYCATAT